MNLRTLLREAVTAARTSPVPSALVLLVVAAMCFAAVATVGRQAATEAAVAAELSGPGARVLTVTDTGGGVAVDQRERIFERFYRSTEARSTPGSGLGLAIAKQVLDRHGCQVAVGESPDGGTRFRVVFPGHAPAEVKRAGSRRVRRRVPGHRHGA